MATYTKEEYESLFGKKVKGSDAPEGSLIDTLMQDNNFRVISDYMEDRMGMSQRNYDKREIVDAYINNMRKFNFGQSITTLEELAHLNKGDGDDLAVRRKKAAEAYKLFDSLGGAFSEGRTFGEKADAVWDYGRALIWDPVNVVSFGVGKLAAAGATKAATQVAKRAALEAAENLAKQSGKKAATTKGKKEIQEAAQKEFMTTLLKDSSYKKLKDKAVRKELLSATAFDTAAAGGIDAARQSAMKKTELQEGYDPIAGMLSLAGGVTGGGLGFVLEKTRGTNRIPIYSQLIDRSERLTLAARKEAADLAKSSANIKENKSALEEGLSKLSDHSQRWADQVKDGLDLRLANKEIDGDSYDALFDYELMHYFYFGDEGQKGLRDIFYDAGVGVWQPREKGDTFNLYMKDVYGILDDETKSSVQKIYDNVFNKFDNTFKDLTLDEYFKKTASISSDAGRTLALSRHMNVLNEVSKKSFSEMTTREAAGLIIDPVTKSQKEMFEEGAAKVQQNLIKFIVTHPGTTALNIKGWLQGSTMQSYSDMIRAALYGGASIYKDLVGETATAASYRNKSRLMLSLQSQKLRNLADPYMTYEATMDMLTSRPEARKELFRYLVGGVEVDDVLKELELDPTETLTRTKFDKFMNFVQTSYGVKAQDFLTKTQEYMYALDKQVRLKYEMPLEDFMQQDNVWEFMADEGSDAFKEFLEIETKAVKQALENTFSKSYADMDGILGAVAKGIEDTRKFPIIGAMMPFGQFFNNTIAFMANHSGVALAYNKYKGTGDLMDLTTKTAAGWTIWGGLVAREQKNMEEGLAWDQERASDGSIISRKFDFPYSHLKLLGRIGAYIVEGEKVPDDLAEEFLKTAGPEALTRSVGEAATSMSELAKSLLNLEFDEAYKQSGRLLGDSVAMYTSGFTRFADPYNQLIAVTRGENYKVVDRNQGSRTINNSLRYLDQFYAVATGEDIAPERESPTNETAGAAPIGRVFGYRTVDAPSTVEKLFNDVERPNWKTGIYGTPESKNMFSKYVFPSLEMYADMLIEDGTWDSLSMDDKKAALDDILKMSKDNVKETLKYSTRHDERKAGLIQEILDKNVSKEDRRKYFRYFGTSEEELWELDAPQLTLLLSFFEDEGIRNKIQDARIGLED